MLSLYRITLIVCAMAPVVVPHLRASDLGELYKVKTWIKPPKSQKSPHRAREFVQRSRTITLRDGDKTFSPTTIGVIYRREKVDGNRLLLSARSLALKGWAPAESVVAVTEADAFFSSQIVQKPGDSFAFLMRGIVRYANDEIDQAFADLNEALRLDPKNITALTARGLLWILRNRSDRALAEFNNALELDPRYSDALANRGMLYASLKEYDKALADFQRAIELGSRIVTIYLFEGLVRTERRELDMAEFAFNRTLEMDPERTDALVGLGIMHMISNKFDEALAVFTKAIQIDPHCDAAYAARANLNKVLDRDDKALADLEQAIRLNREGSLYIYNHGFFMYSRAEFDRALADVETAIRLDPNDEQPHHGRAWILMACPSARIRNGKQAVVSATRACELTKWKGPRYLATLAAAYSEIGDFAAAVKWQETAMGNLDLGSSEANVYRTLFASYKNKQPYRTVGSWQGMWLNGESQRP